MEITGDYCPEQQVFCKITNHTKYPDPVVTVLPNNQANIFIPQMVPLTTKLDLVCRQEERMEVAQVVEYSAPKSESVVAKLQFDRGEIEKSQKLLYPSYNGDCLSFDQSYYTRGVGQVVIQVALEEKIGPLWKKYGVITGAGFGAIQAAFAAAGGSANDLLDFWVGPLRKALNKSIPKKAAEIVVEIAAGMKFDRMPVKHITACLKRLFLRAGTKSDLLMKDCKTELFIPVQDINGRCLRIDRNSFPNLPLYHAVLCSLLDPLWFDTKPLIKGLSVLTGDVFKTNDLLIVKNNDCQITSIGSPVRYYDNGAYKVTREGLSLRMNDQKHVNELMQAENYKNRTRYQCRPMDEIKQFDFSDKAIRVALDSGKGVV